MSCSSSLLTTSPIVINTRPVERAAPLTHHLQAADFTVVDIPMLALQSYPVTENDSKIMQQWLAGEYQALVIVSPTAAASGLAMWQALAQQNKTQSVDSDELKDTSVIPLTSLPAPSHFIAVGTATAAVLEAAQLPSSSFEVLQPAIANNEGMLAMPEIEQLQAGDKLLVWRGLGGRRLLVDTLQARGVHIDSIAWYERTMPAMASEQYQQWQQQFRLLCKGQSIAPKPIVIISSATAFEHWETVVKKAQRLCLDNNENLDSALALTLADFTYVVLGERLANMVAEQQLSYWQVEDLAPETILSALQSSNHS